MNRAIVRSHPLQDSKINRCHKGSRIQYSALPTFSLSLSHTHTAPNLRMRINSYKWPVTFSDKAVLQSSPPNFDVVRCARSILIMWFNITDSISKFQKWLLSYYCMQASFCLYISYARATHSAADVDLEIHSIIVTATSNRTACELYKYGFLHFGSKQTSEEFHNPVVFTSRKTGHSMFSE
jgi:hypothetical protein